MKLNVKAFAVAGGVFWGLGMFLLAWWQIVLHGSGTDAGFLGSVYPGFSLTAVGSLIGLVWGLVDGAISSAIFAALYNCALSCPCCKGPAAEDQPQGSESAES